MPRVAALRDRARPPSKSTARGSCNLGMSHPCEQRRRRVSDPIGLRSTRICVWDGFVRHARDKESTNVCAGSVRIPLSQKLRVLAGPGMRQWRRRSKAKRSRQGGSGSVVTRAPTEPRWHAVWRERRTTRGGGCARRESPTGRQRRDGARRSATPPSPAPKRSAWVGVAPGSASPKHARAPSAAHLQRLSTGTPTVAEAAASALAAPQRPQAWRASRFGLRSGAHLACARRAMSMNPLVSASIDSGALATKLHGVVQ